MDPFTIASLALPFIGNLFGGGGDEQPQSDELERILGIQRTRMAQSQPLHDAILKLAMGLMPTYAQSPMGQAQTTSGARAVPRQTPPPQGY